MPSLASRLSSPQEFYTCLSSPIPSEEFGLQEFTRRHTKRHGHLPVQEQISCVLEDSLEDRLCYRHKEHTPLVPRRKALPRPVPYTRHCPLLADRPHSPSGLPRHTFHLFPSLAESRLHHSPVSPASTHVTTSLSLSPKSTPSSSAYRLSSTARHSLKISPPITALLFSVWETNLSGLPTTSTPMARTGLVTNNSRLSGSVRSLERSSLQV